MPWEVKRWLVFAGLMMIMSFFALTFRPSCYGLKTHGSQRDAPNSSTEAPPTP